MVYFEFVGKNARLKIHVNTVDQNPKVTRQYLTLSSGSYRFK